MPLTPEHNIYYPNSESQFTPLESHFAALATSVDDAMIAQGVDLIAEVFRRAVPTEPIQPTLLNGWANYSANATGYAQAQFYKDVSGIVHIEGFLTKTGSGLDTIFQLPVGYRPRQRQEFVGTTGGSGSVMRFGVQTSGHLVPRDLPTSWAGIACSFRAWN